MDSEIARRVRDLDADSTETAEDAQHALTAMGPDVLDDVIAAVPGMGRFGTLCAIEIFTALGQSPGCWSRAGWRAGRGLRTRSRSEGPNAVALIVHDGWVTTFTIPAGATGFNDRKASPLPLVDLKSLRAAWHTGARLAGCRTGVLIEQSYPKSFHTVTMVDRHENVHHVVLCHMHHPLIAFVTGWHYWYTTEFIDPPWWASVYSAVGFETLSADVLLSPLDKVNTSQLTAADRSQIRYWRPPTVGAALFNHWD